MARASECTTAVSVTNLNSQIVIRATKPPGMDQGQLVHVLQGGICGAEYGANGSDIHLRRCTSCQGSKLAPKKSETRKLQTKTLSDAEPGCAAAASRLNPCADALRRDGYRARPLLGAQTIQEMDLDTHRGHHPCPSRASQATQG